MSRASASLMILLTGVLAGGCSLPSANAPTRPTQWFAQQVPVAQLPAEDPASNTFVFAGKDRLRTVTFAKGDSRELLSVDGRKVRLGKGVQEIFFSPDGRHYAYPGKLGKGRVAVVDGQPRPGLDPCSDMTISADSHHLAYIVGLKGATCAVIDGNLQPAQGFARGPIILTSDAKHWAYQAAEQLKGGREYMVIDGVKGPMYDYIMTCSYWGDDVYYEAKRGNNWYMVGPAGEGEPHEQVGFIYVSPNKKYAAWLVFDAQKSQIVVLANKGKSRTQSACGADTDLLTVLDDGRTICRKGTEGNYELVVGDRHIPTDGMPMTPIADRTGRHVAAVVVKEYGRNVSKGFMQTTQTQHVELDGQKQPEYLMVRGLIFSPGGTHLAYWGMRPDMRWTLVVDGQDVLVFDSVPLGQNPNWCIPTLSPAPITFSGEHTIHALGINGRTVSRVTLSAQ